MSFLNIVSHLPIPIRLFEPHPNPDKPGESGVLRSIVVGGKSHPDARPMVTRGVDADLFHAWKDANGNHPWLINDHIGIVSDDEADAIENGPAAFGWEPGLETVDQTGAEAGSVEGDKPHTDVDMNAYSDVPNDDSPRSQTTIAQPVSPAPQPMDPEPGARSPQPYPVAKPADEMFDAELEHATRPEGEAK